MKAGKIIKRVAIGVAILGVLSVVLGVGGVAGVFWWYGRGVSELDEDALKNYRPAQITRIYSRDGELIGELFSQRRTLIDYESIPTHVENAFLAAEDADFYRHEGMDYPGMVRALIANVKAGEIKQGASTITQQVVKIFMLSPERTFERKVQELILARRLEQAFTKKEIIELYLNEIYLGHGRYGIEEASRYYFGKSVREINLGQAALLATLPKAPGRDSPLKNRERAKGRQVYVLQQMIKHGFATEADAQRFIDADLDLAPASARSAPQTGAEEFVDAARVQLREHYGEDLLDRLGGDVTMTVDLKLQREVRQSVVEGLRGVDARNDYGRKLVPATDEERAAALKAGAGPLAKGQRKPALIEARPSSVELPSHGFAAHVGDHDVFVRVEEGSRFYDPDQLPSERWPVGAAVDVRVAYVATSQPRGVLPAGWSEAFVEVGPESAAVVADVQSGEILAMVGGSNYGLASFNRAMQAKRQPGSSFKPFVYGAALQSKRYTAASLISDSPEIYEKWKPTNFLRDKYRGDIRMRVALTNSVNTVAIKLCDEVGIDAVQAFAHTAGIESEIPESLSIALGTGEVTPYEMTRAYLTLARGGNRLEPALIKGVEAPRGNGFAPEREGAQVLPEDVVFVLASMMQSVVQSGTGAKAKKLGRPVAGKTGTSADFHDAWFAGFTRRRVAVVWVGFDRPQRLGKAETGGKAAIPVWLGAMQAASAGDAEAFPVPPSVTVRRIDDASGLLVPTGRDAADYAGKAIQEYFVAGTEPIEEATPAALPATDVLLDLYDDNAPDSPPLDDAPKPSPGDKLPSLDDEP